MAQTIQILYDDTDPNSPNEIASYMHCGRCLEQKPEDISPKDWSRTQIGIRHDGRFQVWCNRCNGNVAIIGFRLKRNCAE